MEVQNLYKKNKPMLRMQAQTHAQNEPGWSLKNP